MSKHYPGGGMGRRTVFRLRDLFEQRCRRVLSLVSTGGVP